jgi:hypothetical protein
MSSKDGLALVMHEHVKGRFMLKIIMKKSILSIMHFSRDNQGAGQLFI